MRLVKKFLIKIADKFLFTMLLKHPWLLPEPRRGRVLQKIARSRFNRYMRRKLGHFMRPVESGPPGPKEAILRTAVLAEKDVEQKANPDYYFMSGYTQMLDWLKVLERFDFNLRTATAIMELGCGSARLIRHLRCIDGIRLVGCDANAENLDWCKESIPGISFYKNELLPPLPFTEGNIFDLVFAASVFTHIPLDTQNLWIEEMHRVLRPGGFLLADVLGKYHQECMLNSEDRQRLRKSGQLTLDANDPKASLSTRVIGSWDVFQTREQVLRAFGSLFRIHDYIPRGLDLLILQKPGS